MSQLDLLLPDVFSQRRRASNICEAVFAATKARGKLHETARELDLIFGPEGRPVSESVLKACVSPNAERNYYRLEWAVLVLDDPRVQAALRAPWFTPEEENRLMREHFARQAPGVLQSFDRAVGRTP